MTGKASNLGDFGKDMSAMESKRKAMLREFFRVIEVEGNVPAMRFTTEDVVWWHATHGDFTRDAMPSMDRATEKLFDGPLHYTIHAILEDGDRAAVEAEIDAPLLAGGRYRNKYVFLIEFRDDKIAHIKEYGDTLRAFQAFGADVPG